MKAIFLLALLPLILAVTPVPDCPAEFFYHLNWPQTAPRTTAWVVCPTGFTGIVGRRCDSNGVWLITVNGTCTEVSCPAQTNNNAFWHSSLNGQVVHGVCSTNFAGAPYRYCQANGTLSPVQGTPCSQCPADTYGHATWPASLPETMVTGTCQYGYTGTPTRACRFEGVWETFLPTVCSPIELNCSSINEDNAQWPDAVYGAISRGTCNSGFGGNPYRYCVAGGLFGPLFGYNCSQCPADSYGNAMWAASPAGTTVTGTCNGGYSGSASRLCKPFGIWSTYLDTECVPIEANCTAADEDNAHWPAAAYGSISHGTCASGFGGNPYRYCVAGGNFGPIFGYNCSQCAADTYGHATWPVSAAGTTATGTCQPGYTGTPTRDCKPFGIWSTFLATECTQIVCPAGTYDNASFDDVAAGSQIFGKCNGGLSGRPVKVCSITGAVSYTGTACN